MSETTEPDHTVLEARRLLRMAHDEILRLRREVADLLPRAVSYDTIQVIVSNIPRESRGESVDLLWEIQQHVERMNPVKPTNPEIE